MLQLIFQNHLQHFVRKNYLMPANKSINKVLHVKKILLFFSVLYFATPALAQLAGLQLIKESDLKKDLYALADAHFRGRSAGTVDELKAASWMAEKYRSIGLKPAGDDGTYLQYFDLIRHEVDPASTIKINDQVFTLWNNVSVAQMANVSLKEPITYLGNAADVDTNSVEVKDKIVALEASAKNINFGISLITWRYNRYNYTNYALPLIARGAKAIIFIADDEAEIAWADATENFERGTYDIEGGVNAMLTHTVPVLWMHKSAKQIVQNGTAVLEANLIIKKFTYPSANIVGVVPGTDPKLKNEYVLYSGHIDAHGIRNVIDHDSIFYGADDNGSVDVAMLANARAFVKYPGKRSVIFVIHGAEERGLLGSKYFAAHATVPIGNVVAVLNGDMIGRNHIDSAAILGVIPPHLNSAALVNMALAANNEGPKFKLDTQWDKVSHTEGWYFRSDHLPYARLGIPAIMYSSLLHPDYHTPADNAQNINYAKLKKMADWMYRTGYKVANAPTKPAREKGFMLER